MKNQKKIIIGVVIIIVCLCGILFFVNKESDHQDILFPHQFDDGKLEITSLITFDGPNTDNNNQEGESIAALQLTNISNEHLKNLTITLKMEDKQEYSFVIEELPANEQILALEVNNKQYDAKTKCKSLSYESEFIESNNSQLVDVTVKDLTIVTKNTSDKTYKNITVYYHCIADQFYFGGKSYAITIPELLSGKAYSYDDSQCWMGEPKVVRIEIKE